MDELTAAERLARDVVQAVAADELPLFDENVSAARRTGVGGSSGDDVLGIGIEATAVLTPMIIALAKVAVGAAWTMVSPAFAKKAAGPVARLRAVVRKVPLVRWLIPAEKDPGELPQLNPEQLEGIRELVEGRALALGTPVAKAALLAEAVTGRLAVAQP